MQREPGGKWHGFGILHYKSRGVGEVVHSHTPLLHSTDSSSTSLSPDREESRLSTSSSSIKEVCRRAGLELELVLLDPQEIVVDRSFWRCSAPEPRFFFFLFLPCFVEDLLCDFLSFANPVLFRRISKKKSVLYSCTCVGISAIQTCSAWQRKLVICHAQTISENTHEMRLASISGMTEVVSLACLATECVTVVHTFFSRY